MMVRSILTYFLTAWQVYEQKDRFFSTCNVGQKYSSCLKPETMGFTCGK